MFWNVSFTLLMVIYFKSYTLCRFSSKVGMMYFGLRIALLRVWDGSINTQIFRGLVVVCSRSRTTMLDISKRKVEKFLSAGLLLRRRPKRPWFFSSFEIGWQWIGAWVGLTLGSMSKSTGGPRLSKSWNSEVQFWDMSSRLKLPKLAWPCACGRILWGCG